MNGSPSKKIAYRKRCSRKGVVWRGKSGEGLITWQTKKSNQMRELKAEPITERYLELRNGTLAVE